MKTNILFALLGIVIGVLLADRRRLSDGVRRSRTLKEMSPRMMHDAPDFDTKLSMFEHFARTVEDLVQPNLTELEAENVREYVKGQAMALARFDDFYKEERYP